MLTVIEHESDLNKILMQKNLGTTLQVSQRTWFWKEYYLSKSNTFKRKPSSPFSFCHFCKFIPSCL